jgi:hypothetical protein
MNGPMRRATWAQLKMIYRHVPIGFWGVGLLAILLWLPVAMLRVKQEESPLEAGMVWPLLGFVFSFMVGILFGAGLVRCVARATLRLAPSYPQVLHRSLWLAFGATWLLFAAPALLLRPSPGLWWVLPWSLGICAAGLGLGLGMMAQRYVALAAWPFIALMMTQRWWLPSTLETVQPWLRAHAHEGPVAAAAVGWALLGAWAFAAHQVSKRLAKEGATSTVLTPLWKPTSEGAASPEANAPKARRLKPLLLTPKRMSWKTEVGLLAFNGIICYIGALTMLANTVSPWLVVWASLGCLGGLAHTGSAWASPRLLLVPGGAGRASLPSILFWHAMQGCAWRWPAYALVATVAVCAASGAGPGHGAAIVLVLFAAMIVSASVAVVMPSRTTSSYLIAFVPLLANALFAMAAAALAQRVFGSTFAHAPTWLGWALSMCLLAVVLATVLLTASRRVWAQMDWATLPSTPVVAGQNVSLTP